MKAEPKDNHQLLRVDQVKLRNNQEERGIGKLQERLFPYLSSHALQSSTTLKFSVNSLPNH